MPNASPHLRAVPSQARSTATLDLILASARAILEEKGIQALNTNAVAERAGVNVATLYRYFPNKNAILRELLERAQAERTAFLSQRVAFEANSPDLPAWFDGVTQGLLDYRRAAPADLALRRACRAVPELADVEARLNAEGAAELAAAFRRWFPDIDPGRLDAAANVVFQSGRAVLDHASENEDTADTILAELGAMLRAYLRVIQED